MNVHAKGGFVALMIAALAAPGAALAGAEKTPAPSTRIVTADVVERIRGFLAADLVHRSIAAQNQDYGALTQSKIDQLDQQWRAERKSDDKPLISRKLSNPLSIYLTRVQSNEMGLYAAIFVMDQNGLNVGQSAITGDYWQGDESKFKKTFHVAADAVFVDEPEWVEDFGFWIAQVNLTLTDPKTGQAIGAATVDVNLHELQRRRSVGLSF